MSSVQASDTHASDPGKNSHTSTRRVLNECYDRRLDTQVRAGDRKYGGGRMPVAEILDGKIAVRTQYHERHLVQQVPGARYDKNAGHWMVPLSWASCITLRGVFGSDLATGSELTKWSWEVYNNRIKPATD